MRDMDLGPDLLAGEQALALSQARPAVAIQVAALAAIIAAWTLLGFPRHLAWTLGVVAAGAVTTIADLRWWLWLREATPAEAFERLQSRSELVAPPCDHG